MLHFKAESQLVQKSFLLWGYQALVLFRPSTAWVRPTHVLERASSFPQNPLIRILISSKNTLTETSGIMFVPIPEHSGPGKLAHKPTTTPCHQW